MESINKIILENLEKGRLPWETPWLESGSRLPQNRSTGKPYSGMNVWTLLANMMRHNYKHNEWATYKQWESLGGQVRKGETGTKLMFYKQVMIQDKLTGEPKFIPRVNYFTVFNIGQVDGVEPLKQDLVANIIEIDNLIAATKAVIHYDQLDRAFYLPSTDEIHLPARNYFKSEAALYSTVFHELGHWTASRVGRKLSPRLQRESYAFEELVAELCSAYLCAQFNLSYEVQHAAYIQGWITVLKDDSTAFEKAAALAQKAANFIINSKQNEETLKCAM